MLYAFFMLDEIFTGEFNQYKIIDGPCKLLKSKSDQK